MRQEKLLGVSSVRGAGGIKKYHDWIFPFSGAYTMLQRVDITAYHFCFYIKFMPNKWFLFVFFVLILRITFFFCKGVWLCTLLVNSVFWLWKSLYLCELSISTLKITVSLWTRYFDFENHCIFVSYTPIKLGKKRGKKSPADLPEGVWLVLCSPTVDAGPAQTAQFWMGLGFLIVRC